MFNFLGNLRQEELSDYNVIIQNEDGYVVYNQLSGSMALLDAEQYEEYRKIKKGNFFVDAGLLKVLRNGHFVKSKQFDEVAWMSQKYETIKHAPANKALTIVVTDKCNLGCVYCYEDKHQWKNMPTEIVEQLKKFFDVFITSSPTEKFSVAWFGGEPMLNLKCIEDLSGHFNQVCQQNNIQYSQYIITNGTTITPAAADRLWKIGIKSMQITLDGIKEDHDQARPYLRDMQIEDMTDAQIKQRRQIEPLFGLSLNILGQEPVVRKEHSSFDAIMQGLHILYERGFQVSLRCNVNSKNYQNFHKLQDQLKDLTQPHKSGGVIALYTAQIFDYGESQGLRDFSREEYAAKQCGEPLTLRNFNGTSCSANQQFNFCISQSGKISKCWHHVSNEEHVIGDVFDLQLANQGFVDGFSPFEDEECLSCGVLPTCLGGCKSLNEYYEKGYDGAKLNGCETHRWNIRGRVNKLYQDTIKGNKAVSIKGARFD